MGGYGHCPQHPSEPVRLLCVPCRQRICLDCKIFLHEGHRPTLKLVEAAPTKAPPCSSSSSFDLEPNRSRCAPDESRHAPAAEARAGSGAGVETARATPTPTRKLEKEEGPSQASPKKTFLGGLLHRVDCKVRNIKAVMTKSREKSPSTDKVCPRCEISPPMPPRRPPSCPTSYPRQRRQAPIPSLTIAPPTEDASDDDDDDDEHSYLELLDDRRQAPTPSLSTAPTAEDASDDEVDEDNDYIEVPSDVPRNDDGLGQGQGQDAVYIDAVSASAAQDDPLYQNYPDVFL